MPKPVRKKKHFIRKKEATTYRLIPGYVEDDDDTGAKPSEEEKAKRKEEQREVGIFFDDDYNYMKHVRSVNEQATLVNTETFQIDASDETRSHASMPFPFKEFFSTDETEGEEIDPEILAALDEAPEVPIEDGEEGGDDFLDDDFIEKAGGVSPQKVKTSDMEQDFDDDREFDFDDEDEDEDDESESDDDSEFSGRVSDLSFEEGDTSESRKRQGRGTAEDDIIEAQTALILKNFEEGLGFRCSTQDTMEDEEMPTDADLEHLKHIMKHDVLKEKPVSWSDVLDDKSERPKVDSSKYLYEDEDEYVWKDAPPSKPKYDCVSILSLRSNTRNLPTDLIPPSKAKTNKKPGQQSDTESTTSATHGLTLRQLEQEMRDSRRADKASTFRPVDETAEEKRARKKALKDERKERRQEKKANKMVFSIENEKMKKESATLSKSVKSVKLS